MQPHNFNTKKTEIHIRNMVSHSCLRIVREQLEQTGFVKVHYLELGRAEIAFDQQVISLSNIDEILKKNGFGLIRDKESQLVEQIKTAVIELIFYAGNANSLIRNSDYLSQKLGEPYTVLSRIFSERTGTTLEKYMILIKIEKIKEQISYGETSLSEIAYNMGYSSVQYLSNQFRQVTGYSVSEYKNLMHKDRKPLTDLI